MSTAPPVIPSMIAEGVVGRGSGSAGDRRTIVIARLHAFGDTAITLPVIGGIRRSYPGARIVVVTSPPSESLFKAVEWIDRTVVTEGSGRGRRAQIGGAIRIARLIDRPDLLIDLQRSRATRLIRLLLHPRSWVAFDRFAPRTAFERYLEAARWIDPGIAPDFDPPVQAEVIQRADRMLRDHGWRDEPLLCLNPAGCWPTKNWPLDRFREAGRRLLKTRGMRTVLIGTDAMRKKGKWLAQEIPGAIDLVEKTSAAEALALMRRLALMITEDSGLMHLAAISGVRVVALFGATRATWSAPAGDNITLYSSEDMECGACMSPLCARGDTECLMRVGVEFVD